MIVIESLFIFLTSRTRAWPLFNYNRQARRGFWSPSLKLGVAANAPAVAAPVILAFVLAAVHAVACGVGASTVISVAFTVNLAASKARSGP